MKNALILNVDALEEANQPFEADLPREFLDGVLRADPPTEFHADGSAHLAGRATKMGRKVLVQARAVMKLKGQCKRCLKPVAVDEQVEMIRTWVPHEPAHKSEPRKSERKGELRKSEPHKTEPRKSEPRKSERHERRGEEVEATFDPDTVDEESYQGKEIDLSPAVREQILLSVPAAPLCGEDCKGLCPKCGKDLNEGDCGCDRSVIDPRWAALKGIQLKKEK